MSEKGLKVLAGVVVLLFLAWGAVSLSSEEGGGDSPIPADLARVFSETLSPEVHRVRIRKPEATEAIVLTRGDGHWTVNGYQADSATVSRFWETMEEASLGDLVAANPANHARMGLSPDSALTLEMEGPDGAVSVLVGKNGTGFGTVYVRLPREDAVYLLRGNLRSHMTRDLEGWRNKRLARVDTSQVQRLEIEGEESRVTLTRSDSLWVLGNGATAAGPPVRSLLAELTRLDASGFLAPSDTLPDQGGALRAFSNTGDTLLDLRLGAGDGDRWARVSGDSILYRLPGWRAGRLLPDAENLREGG